MAQYDFSIRSGSFLNSDSKLHDEYIKSEEKCSYNKLVGLNIKVNTNMNILRRLYSFRYQYLKSAVIT